jgi:hypothetical protein
LFDLDQNSRLAGEEASHEMMSDNLIAFISELFGRSFQDLSNSDFLPHTKLRLVDRDGTLMTRVNYNTQETEISVTAILAILLHQVASEIAAPLTLGEASIDTSPMSPPSSLLAETPNFGLPPPSWSE